MPTSDWAPTVAGVGALLRARTKDTNGNEVGTFTALTRPTDADVTTLMDGPATDVVADRIGWDIPDVFWPRAATAVQLQTAMLIELSYFPEQVGSGRSPYGQIKTMFDDHMSRLEAAIAVYDDTGEEGEVPTNVPNFTFPSNMGGMVGWRTRW